MSTDPAPRSRVEGLLEEGRKVADGFAMHRSFDDRYVAALIRSLCEALGETMAAEVRASMRCGELLGYLGSAQKDVARLRAALEPMVDRWEPDCGGTDRRMWENAKAALKPRQETKAEALASLGLTRGKAADGTEVWE